MKSDLLDARFAISFDLLRTDGPDFRLEVFERGGEHPFATRDGDVASLRDSKDAAAHGAEMCGAVAGPPAHNGRNKRSQQVCVARQYAKAAALVFGSHRRDIAAVDEASLQ